MTADAEIRAKTVEVVLPAPAPHWVGDGFQVRPIFADAAFTDRVSPFLMFDWAAPRDFPPSRTPRGVGPHPHRGFETVTLVYAGEVEHRDSAGHGGRIGPGDVQWMTAGSGVLHEEVHSRAATEAGGPVSMAQLWVNLPATAKMMPPRYQAITAQDIPTVRLGGARFRVVAGELAGDDGVVLRGPAATVTPLAVLDGVVAAGDSVDLPIPRGWRTSIAVLSADPVIAGQTVRGPGVACLSDAGDFVRIAAGAQDARVLVLTGRPIDEPIAHLGPFVMNTRAELEQAVFDFRSGAMGRL